VLSAAGAAGSTDNTLDLGASIDGLGNIVAAWSDTTSVQAATFDVSAPSFTRCQRARERDDRTAVAMSSTTFDAWGSLGVGQPGWSFGDGATGTGPTVTHVFATPGTYTVSVGASDTVGNVAAPATRQIVISNAPVPPLPATTVTRPTAKIIWKAGKLSNSSITLKGTVAAPPT